MGGQRHAPAALLPGKTRYPSYRWLGGPQARCGRVRKISRPPGIDPRTVQPVASSYTDCANPALPVFHYAQKFLQPARPILHQHTTSEDLHSCNATPNAAHKYTCLFKIVSLLGYVFQSRSPTCTFINTPIQNTASSAENARKEVGNEHIQTPQYNKLYQYTKFYSHQLMHFFIQLCTSLLSYIKIT